MEKILSKIVEYEPSAIAGFIVQEVENKNLHENGYSMFNPLIPSDKDDPTLEPRSSPALGTITSTSY